MVNLPIYKISTSSSIVCNAGKCVNGGCAGQSFKYRLANSMKTVNYSRNYFWKLIKI